jgi:hypothetical protein
VTDAAPYTPPLYSVKLRFGSGGSVLVRDEAKHMGFSLKCAVNKTS